MPRRRNIAACVTSALKLHKTTDMVLQTTHKPTFEIEQDVLSRVPVKWLIVRKHILVWCLHSLLKFINPSHAHNKDDEDDHDEGC